MNQHQRHPGGKSKNKLVAHKKDAFPTKHVFSESVLQKNMAKSGQGSQPRDLIGKTSNDPGRNDNLYAVLNESVANSAECYASQADPRGHPNHASGQHILTINDQQ